MKKFILYFWLLFLIPGIMLSQDNRADLGISVADGKLRSFYLAVGDYYGHPGREVAAAKERYRLRDEELPVLYFLAARARVGPSAVIDFRVQGMSWLDITFHYGLTPEIFFVPVTVQKVGPPYGKAYGHYNKYRPNKEWKKIKLSDHEVVDLVNLRFISEHYHLRPEAVMEMRGRGKSYLTINQERWGKKEKMKGSSGKDKKDQAGKGKGRKKTKRH
jgi:hypothetical protein